MKTQDIPKRAVWKMTLFIATAFMLAVTFHACQQDEIMPEPEEIGLKEELISEIELVYPDQVTAGEDFDITYFSGCGRIMIEQGYTVEVNPETGETIKVYCGLGCDTQNLLWETIGADEFVSCQGETITRNLAEPGTYVYRVKLNFKAFKDTDCEDCDFRKNEFKCFEITVAASSQTSFTDTRDGKEYKIVTLGNQTWMAENLAYLPAVHEVLDNSSTEARYFVYGYNGNDVSAAIATPGYATYGVYYNWTAAQDVCPEGWHLPTLGEWETLENYLIAHGYNYDGTTEGNKIAKALAAKTSWYELNDYWSVGTPGNQPLLNNSSGFTALAGTYKAYNGWQYFTYFGRWWSSTLNAGDMAVVGQVSYSFIYLQLFEVNIFRMGCSIRCVKDAK